MIRTSSQSTKYQTRFTNGQDIAISDTTKNKGGTGQGFRPHELIEAALANCMNITLRMSAEKHAIPLDGVTVTVSLDRSNPDEPVFEYSVGLQGELSEDQKKVLMASVRNCPVRNTLSKSLSFRKAEKETA